MLDLPAPFGLTPILVVAAFVEVYVSPHDHVELGVELVETQR
jgi:hypothetical protein